MRSSLFWTLLNSVTNCHFFKSQRLFRLEIYSSSAFEHSAFVGSAISDLIRQGCVTEVFEKPIIINSLSVSIQKSGKERLILDLRHVNQFLFKQKFRC